MTVMTTSSVWALVCLLLCMVGVGASMLAAVHGAWAMPRLRWQLYVFYTTNVMQLFEKNNWQNTKIIENLFDILAINWESILVFIMQYKNAVLSLKYECTYVPRSQFIFYIPPRFCLPSKTIRWKMEHTVFFKFKSINLEKLLREVIIARVCGNVEFLYDCHKHIVVSFPLWISFESQLSRSLQA